MALLSRSNLVIAVFVVLAFAAVGALTRFTTTDPWVPFAVLVAVGVLAPQLVNGYLDARAEREG
jgi:hypothetical protein